MQDDNAYEDDRQSNLTFLLNQFPAPEDFEDDDGLVEWSDEEYEDGDNHADVEKAITRLHVLASKFTAEEWWASILAIKIRGNLPDYIVRLFAKTVKAASISVSATIPTTRHAVAAELANAVPFAPKYVCFCAECDLIVCTSTSRIHQAECPGCEEDLTDALRRGRNYFIVYSIREQLQGYLHDERLCRILRDYLPHLDSMMSGCQPYSQIIRSGNFSLTVCIDAAQQTKRSGVKMFPAIFLLQQLPVAAQFWYPILGAMFCAKTPLPSSRVLLEENLNELRAMENNKPLSWVDKSLDDRRRFSRVFLTICETDAPQKAEICNHMAHGGRYACPYCEMEGTPVNATTYPDHFSPNNTNPLKGTASNSVKFPDLLHEVDVRMREHKDRMKIGEEVVMQKITSNARKAELMKMHNVGIKGVPAINGFKHFDDVWSHTSDILHVACEGLVKVSTFEIRKLRASFK
jgi:hypothetical protein